MDLAGGVDVAGVLLITVGHLAVVVVELCTQAAIPATVPLVVHPNYKAATFLYKHFSALKKTNTS